MSSHFDVLAVSSPEKMLEEVATHEGVRTASVNMTRSITQAKDLQALWGLYRLFKKEKPTGLYPLAKRKNRGASVGFAMGKG